MFQQNFFCIVFYHIIFSDFQFIIVMKEMWFKAQFIYIKVNASMVFYNSFRYKVSWRYKIILSLITKNWQRSKHNFIPNKIVLPFSMNRSYMARIWGAFCYLALNCLGNVVTYPRSLCFIRLILEKNVIIWIGTLFYL